MASRSPLIHVFDAPVYVFRAYYSLPEMRAPDGSNTHAAYGFANTLIKYLSEEKPTHVAITFDHILVYHQSLEPHGPATVQSIRTDAHLSAESITKPVRKPGRRVVEHRGRIDALEKA